MSYQVIARRYRPQTFKEVIGQEHISETLSRSVKGKRIGHAFLFCGPRGCGKTTTARILAKALNCLKGPAEEPCNECENCKSITEGYNIDVIEIDAASNRGIDEARQLREYVQLAPSGMSRYRVYIIDEVHMMTKEAFNALLKTLEEPPSHAIFILATTEKNKVPITIISRCQQFDFKFVSVENIIKQLNFIIDNEPTLKINPEQRGAILSLLARAAKGSMRDGESILEQLIAFSAGEIDLEKANALLGTMPEELMCRWVDAILSADNRTALLQMNSLLEQGIDFEQLCHELLDYFRSLAMMKVLGKDTLSVDLTIDERERRMTQAEPFKEEQLVRLMKLCTHSIEQIRKTVPGKVVMELLSLDAIQVRQTLPMVEIVNQLKQLQRDAGPAGRATPVRPADNDPPPPGYSLADQYKKISQPVNSTPEKKTELTAEKAVVNKPSPAPAPVTAPISKGDITAILPLWKDVVTELQKTQGTFAACVSQCAPIRMDDSSVVLGISSTNPFYRSMLENPQNREILENTLEKYSGKKYRIKTEITETPIIINMNTSEESAPGETEAPSIEDYKRHPLIRHAIDIFGATGLELKTIPKPKAADTETEEKEDVV